MISPLSANVYLHWFDKPFYRADGPARWANARLVRYAGDFVVLARYQTPRLIGWIEEKIEKWLGLEINRDKTRVVELGKGKSSPDFLGYTFRWHRDQYGRAQRYPHVGPSKKAVQRERDRQAESATEGLGQLLFAGIPEPGVPEHRLASRLPAGEPLEASSQPAPVPKAGGDVVLRTSPTAGLRVPEDRPVQEPLTRVFR